MKIEEKKLETEEREIDLEKDGEAITGGGHEAGISLLVFPSLFPVINIGLSTGMAGGTIDARD